MMGQANKPSPQQYLWLELRSNRALPITRTMKPLLPLATLIGLQLATTALAVQPQATTIYFNRFSFSTGKPGTELWSMKPDGSERQLLSVALPEPTFPSASRDGALLAVTANDPQSLTPLRSHVFVFSPPSGAFNRVGPAVDSLTLNLPRYKAFSPDKQRVAVGTRTFGGAASAASAPSNPQNRLAKHGTPGDRDGDGIPDDRDPDANGNGVLDEFEGGARIRSIPLLLVYTLDQRAPITVHIGSQADSTVQPVKASIGIRPRTCWFIRSRLASLSPTEPFR